MSFLSDSTHVIVRILHPCRLATILRRYSAGIALYDFQRMYTELQWQARKQVIVAGTSWVAMVCTCSQGGALRPLAMVGVSSLVTLYACVVVLAGALLGCVPAIRAYRNGLIDGLDAH